MCNQNGIPCTAPTGGGGRCRWSSSAKQALNEASESVIHSSQSDVRCDRSHGEDMTTIVPTVHGMGSCSGASSSSSDSCCCPSMWHDHDHSELRHDKLILPVQSTNELNDNLSDLLVGKYPYEDSVGENSIPVPDDDKVEDRHDDDCDICRRKKIIESQAARLVQTSSQKQQCGKNYNTCSASTIATGNSTSKTSQYYTICEVRRHNTVDSAWIIVGNKIYDATSYIHNHPGGIESILKCSGGSRDCTTDYMFHSKRGQAMFTKHCIGQLIPCSSSSPFFPSISKKTSNSKKDWWMIW
jgi:cytochrome b involved in lipid metabolism